MVTDCVVRAQGFERTKTEMDLGKVSDGWPAGLAQRENVPSN